MTKTDIPEAAIVYCAICKEELAHTLEVDLNNEVIGQCSQCQHFIKFCANDLCCDIALHGAHNV